MAEADRDIVADIAQIDAVGQIALDIEDAAGRCGQVDRAPGQFGRRQRQRLAGGQHRQADGVAAVGQDARADPDMGQCRQIQIGRNARQIEVGGQMARRTGVVLDRNRAGVRPAAGAAGEIDPGGEFGRRHGQRGTRNQHGARSTRAVDEFNRDVGRHAADIDVAAGHIAFDVKLAAGRAVDRGGADQFVGGNPQRLARCQCRQRDRRVGIAEFRGDGVVRDTRQPGQIDVGGDMAEIDGQAVGAQQVLRQAVIDQHQRAGARTQDILSAGLRTLHRQHCARGQRDLVAAVDAVRIVGIGERDRDVVADLGQIDTGSGVAFDIEHAVHRTAQIERIADHLRRQHRQLLIADQRPVVVVVVVVDLVARSIAKLV